MIRANILLLFVCVLCALAAVTSQHQARKIFQALEHEEEGARDMEVEYGQLQLELSTWATAPRIEKIAKETLKMSVPAAARVIAAKTSKGAR